MSRYAVNNLPIEEEKKIQRIQIKTNSSKNINFLKHKHVNKTRRFYS